VRFVSRRVEQIRVQRLVICPTEGGKASWLVAAFLALSCGLPGYALGIRGGRITLVRKYRPGESTVYKTETHTSATIQTDPAGIVAFLPSLPRQVSTRQQNTLTIEAVHTDGTADVKNHFDRFALEYQLPDDAPKEIKDSVQQGEQELCRSLNGQTVVAHYDRLGQLRRFEASGAMFQPLSAPLRQPLEQALQLFLDQMGGSIRYPDHPLKPKEEWRSHQSVPATSAIPWTIEGESTFRYVGQTEYQGVKAAVVDFQLKHRLIPVLQSLPAAKTASLAQTNALHIQVNGQGEGRLLVALDDGRTLQNHAVIHETLNASVKDVPGIKGRPAQDPITVEIKTETRLEMDGTGRISGEPPTQTVGNLGCPATRAGAR
jgi:hypothetical protein